MKKKENNIFISDLSDIEKLYLYEFLLRIRQNDGINYVNYNAKIPKSQGKNNKKVSDEFGNNKLNEKKFTSS